MSEQDKDVDDESFNNCQRAAGAAHDERVW